MTIVVKHNVHTHGNVVGYLSNPHFNRRLYFIPPTMKKMDWQFDTAQFIRAATLWMSLQHRWLNRAIQEPTWDLLVGKFLPMLAQQFGTRATYSLMERAMLECAQHAKSTSHVRNILFQWSPVWDWYCGISQTHYDEAVLINWSFPEREWIKLNTDGASKGNPGPSGAGGVLRDYTGRWLGGFVANIGRCSAMEAEQWGLLYGLELAWMLGFRRILVESDSKNLVQGMKENLPKHMDATLFNKCQELMRRDWVIDFEHTYREGNRVADCLANQGLCLESRGVQHLFSPPSMVLEILLQDICGVSQPRIIKN